MVNQMWRMMPGPSMSAIVRVSPGRILRASPLPLRQFGSLLDTRAPCPSRTRNNSSPELAASTSAAHAVVGTITSHARIAFIRIMIDSSIAQTKRPNRSLFGKRYTPSFLDLP